MIAVRYLVDTNILLRLFVLKDIHSAECQRAISNLKRQDVPLCFTLQNASEFWNTCTRPIEGNGLAMEPFQAGYALRVLLTQFTVLTDTAAVFSTWMDLVVRYNVRGVQTHDAKLVAAMMVHSVPAILTLNDKHFRRFDILVTKPTQVQL